jgi:hypothetical protein
VTAPAQRTLQLGIIRRVMETKARFTVDADHCQWAADELYEIFRVQHRGFVERWHAARTTRFPLPIQRNP